MENNTKEKQEEPKFSSDEVFKEVMLNRLRVLIENIVEHIKEQKRIVEDENTKGIITQEIYEERMAQILNLYNYEYLRDDMNYTVEGDKYPIRCPNCDSDKRELIYTIHIYLDDSDIIDRECPQEYTAHYLLERGYPACKAIFTFYCNNTECSSYNKKHIRYGHYIRGKNGKPYNNLYPKQYCLGDILKNPQNYENI